MPKNDTYARKSNSFDVFSERSKKNEMLIDKQDVEF